MDDAELTLQWQRQALERADEIICVSHATAEELRNRFPISSNVTVIHHGSSFPVCSEPQDPLIFENPTFLYVGGRGGYKNFSLLLRAFACATQIAPNIQLHIVGADFTVDERWQIHFLGIEKRVTLTVFPSNAVLKDLYRRSIALLYPSRNEGFGIPPIEAMACGTVAVTSNTTSLPEVMGDAGIMLDPSSESDWTECIRDLAQGRSDREALIQRGFRRVENFSWDRATNEHVAVYNRLA
jgi:glycosyltransferase involved in cell wall biosynthesis